MQKRSLIIAPLAFLALAGCQTAYQTAATEIGSATLQDRQGNTVGSARMYSLGGEVTLNASFTGLSAGTHAVHLHTTGDCTANDFTSAGGHLNPRGNEHGTLNPQGAHLGDLPNVTIAADGTGTMSTLLRGTADFVGDSVFDADGTAIVVHEGADDYRSDPAGDAGSRVACGLVTRS
ncbi:superoxide dismutase family protein [Aurantiacibacter aquimixticola]|uniref:Superoxide dismutase [Cu-Zn] n=1 Tax=Aurantiacibacter aquimixticola TaxID=1958945 RepID=A0A419RV87_9SPHN|nr:superoxide dismutase family protein [Aurantiacibacter aquimixticola]RJY09680.1 superoxide dismutase family protein [Aurantiacibacter aquimixticola]